jgi:hypothetical protein
MSYKLELPPSGSIHPVFHVSQLKQHVGNKKVFEELPTMADESSLQPQTLLDRRIVKHRNRAATQLKSLCSGRACLLQKQRESSWKKSSSDFQNPPSRTRPWFGGGGLLQAFFWNELEGETITVGEI